MKIDQLRGYLLEEALAYLIKSAGYKLITHPGAETNLRLAGAGLQIRGRGAWHQADVLGRLEMVPAFTYPMRLFTEAKYYTNKPLGVPPVRNAAGTITDLNTMSLAVAENGLPISYNYRYEYALFSASGFNKEATEMALAYGISLIDLSGSDYKPLLNAIHKAAERILSSNVKSVGIVRLIREIMRRSFGSEDFIRSTPFRHDLDMHLQRDLDDLIEITKSYGRLYIGTVNAPFMLLLKANDPTSFEDYSFLMEGSDHYIDMHWNSSVDNGEKWIIQPENDRNAYTLSFKVPNLLYKWIFTKEAREIEKAKIAKNTYLSEISIYLSKPGIDKVIKLKLKQLPI